MKNHKCLRVMSTCLLTLAVFVSLALLTPIKADAATEGYYTYTVSNGEATITECNTSISGDITIPSTLGGYPVTSIGDSAFYECTSLTSVTIPDSVESIGDSAFSNCIRLTGIWVDENNTAYSSDSYGILFNKDKTTLTQTPRSISGNYTIPNSVTSIGDWAFCGCSLASVTIPDSVTSIGDYAFFVCNNLGSVTIPDSVESIGDSAFYSCTSLGSVTIGNSVTSIGDSAFSGCDSLTSVTIPDSVTSIGDGTFSYCTSLQSVTIGNSVKSIGYAAFFGCDNLASVTIPDSVKSIGASVFYNCTSLGSVTVGNSVTSIGNYAFYSCTSLGRVTIPDSVTSIGFEAFDFCLNLTNVYYGGTQSQWESISIGSENEYLTSATIHYNHIHDYTVLPATTVNPNCTEKGYIEYTCVWGETYRESLPALGHSTGADGVVTPPTCTAQGYTTSSCPRCGITVTTDYVAALGHDYTGPVGTVDPTCTEQGYTGNTCTRCGDVEKINPVDALGHKMALVPASDPTCEKPGLTAGTACQRCGLVGVAQKEVAATGHSYVDHEAKAPTCTEPGWEAYQTCENCDYSTYVEQPAGHRVYTETTVLVDPITVTNDSDMPFVLVDGVYYSQNHTDGSASEFTITVQYDCTVKFICGVSSETGFDRLYILINDYQMVDLSGEQNGYAYEHNLYAGDIVTIRYSKDSSVNNGDDRGWVQLVYENVEATGMGDVQIDTLNPSCVNPITCTYCNTVFGHSFENDVCTDCGHKKVDVKITGVTLRPGCAGLYFKGSFAFDTDVAVSRYGIAVSLYSKLPVADDSDATSLYTVGENSVLISNILGEGKNGRDLIYARPYALLEDGTYIYGDVVVTNLKSVVETVDAKFDGLSAAQQTALNDLYQQNAAVMQTWNVPNMNPACPNCGTADQWTAATCQTPKTCTCGATKGTTADHIFENGSCIYCQLEETVTLDIEYMKTTQYVAYQKTADNEVTKYELEFSCVENNSVIFSTGMYWYYADIDYPNAIIYEGKKYCGGDGGFGGYWYVVCGDTLQAFDEWEEWLNPNADSLATYVMLQDKKLRLVDGGGKDFPVIYDVARS